MHFSVLADTGGPILLAGFGIVGLLGPFPARVHRAETAQMGHVLALTAGLAANEPAVNPGRVWADLAIWTFELEPLGDMAHPVHLDTFGGD